MKKRRSDYTLGDSTFRVEYGNIIQAAVDAFVSSDDDYLSMGGGVSASLLSAAGDVIAEEARKHVPLKLGDVAVTSAGKLRAKYIFHVVTISYEKMEYASAETIKAATYRCLQLADSLGIRTLAFPALGTGVARVPFAVAAEVMTRAIADYLLGDTRLEVVTLTLFAREHVQEEDLNLFYERSVALASLHTQSKRLSAMFGELSKMAHAWGRPGLVVQVDDLHRELERAREVLSRHPESVEQVRSLQEQSGVAGLAKQAVDMTTEVYVTTTWDDRDLEAQVLRTKLTGLLAQLNIQTSNLNRYQIERAKYGGQLVPPRLEVAIDDIDKEIVATEQQIRNTRLHLATVVQGGGADAAR